jgi:hypothetical protein
MVKGARFNPPEASRSLWQGEHVPENMGATVDSKEVDVAFDGTGVSAINSSPVAETAIKLGSFRRKSTSK